MSSRGRPTVLASASDGNRMLFRGGHGERVTRLGGGILPCTEDGEETTVVDLRVRAEIEPT